MPRTRKSIHGTAKEMANKFQDPPPPSKRIKLARTDAKELEQVQVTQRAKKTSGTETFLPRVNSRWKVGAHVSAAGGIENAVINAASIGANAFALFLKSQRKWTSPALSEHSIALFKEKMIEYKYSSDVVLPHGSYLINLGNPDSEKRQKSYDCFLDDLRRCESLGLKYYNFHPGSTVGNTTKEESISLIAECLNNAHRKTSSVVTVIENMAGAGNIIGGDFADLRVIIEQVVDKSRVGVCLDTCHSFAAGYDFRTKEAWDDMSKATILAECGMDWLTTVVNEFDKIVGLSYLRGMHLNDSKTMLGSRKDRHENIGVGYLGLSAFRNLMNDERVQGIPLILETPSFEAPREVWAKEIAVLQQLSEAVTNSTENQDVLRSIIGDGRDDEILANVITDVVKAMEGAKTIKTAGKQRTKVGKRKRHEDDNDDEAEGQE